MKHRSIAALALMCASSLRAQTAAPAADYNVATPLGGNWSYAATADGSEAVFRDASARPQLMVHCTRATRRVAIARPASGAAPFLAIWTSSQSRNAPASFDPATARLTATFAATDPLLDAIAFSRGRIAIAVGSAPAVVLPPWPEPARVIEDCRG